MGVVFITNRNSPFQCLVCRDTEMGSNWENEGIVNQLFVDIDHLSPEESDDERGSGSDSTPLDRRKEG